MMSWEYSSEFLLTETEQEQVSKDRNESVRGKFHVRVESTQYAMENSEGFNWSMGTTYKYGYE